MNIFAHMFREICIMLLLNYDVSLQKDVYTAVAEIEYLLGTHKTILDFLQVYLMKYERRLSVFKSYLHIFKKEHDISVKNMPRHLNNPINIFTLTKHLAVDLKLLKHSLYAGNHHHQGYNQFLTSIERGSMYPTTEDLGGAAEGLVRLQYVYHLNTRDIADGILNGVAYSAPMTACDCYELGRFLYHKNNFENGLEWILEAYRRYKKERIQYTFSDIDLMEYISYGYSKVGDMDKAIYWILKIFEIDPQNVRAKEIEQQCRLIMKELTHYGVKMLRQPEKDDVRELRALGSFYNPVCRGDMELPIDVTSRLTCRYQTEHDPFTKLAPFKIEMLYRNPDIIMFHDILSDKEIDVVLELSRAKLQRSRLATHNTSKNRISKSGWLEDYESDVVARISRRVKHMTGLNTATSELLQVANYGLGGFYTLHHDFFSEEMPDDDYSNRIATVLFYLSTVTQGGATVFPVLGVGVNPVKGSAIYWNNLYPSGEGCQCLQHAACPVLIGSKWVATKWLRTKGQEFIRPCNLEYQKEGCFDNFPPPVRKASIKKETSLIRKHRKKD